MIYGFNESIVLLKTNNSLHGNVKLRLFNLLQGCSELPVFMRLPCHSNSDVINKMFC